MIRRLFLLLPLLFCSPHAMAANDPIQWQAWSPQVFERAKAERKLVFLYLEAVWCHWCHVMQAETFPQLSVQRVLARNYIAVKVDHDANPLLANRYRDYGWPALILFAADGTELVKRAGYMGPEDFAPLLQRTAKNPVAEADAVVEEKPSTGKGRLSLAQRKYLLRRHQESYDAELGGLRTAQKFIDRDSVEYALAHMDDMPGERQKAEQTLTAAMALIDPVWGGMYQYSTRGGWKSPHYEKIMRTQAGALRIYSLAYGRMRRPEDLGAARSIQAYLLKFLRAPNGAFYASQDADLIQGQKSTDYFALDDVNRRKKGMPRIDQHHYADFNAQAAEALIYAYRFAGDESALQAAKTAMQWVYLNRSRRQGGFHHGDTKDGPYLNDTLAMARAELNLYQVTADQASLEKAVKHADFVIDTFRAQSGGFIGAPANLGGPLRPIPFLEENISAARFFNLLAHYSGVTRHRDAATHAMNFLANDALVFEVFEEAGILLADEELSGDPAHLTIVGSKDDATAKALFLTALQQTGSYARIEWKESPSAALMNDDVTYPKLGRAAGYVCAQKRCSAPRVNPEDYAAAIRATLAASASKSGK